MSPFHVIISKCTYTRDVNPNISSFALSVRSFYVTNKLSRSFAYNVSNELYVRGCDALKMRTFVVSIPLEWLSVFENCGNAIANWMCDMQLAIRLFLYPFGR